MRIYVDRFYQNTKGDKVQAGEHNASDLPSGLAQYLVDNGHAVVIEAKEEIKRAVTLSENDGNSVNITSDDELVSEHDRLSAEYEALTGKAPAWNIGIDTLRQRIADLRSDD